MTDRTKALGALALGVLIAFEISWLLTPWAETVAALLLFGIALPVTVFSIAYMFTRPWWTTAIGRAMLVSSLSLALLVNIALLYRYLGDDYALRDAVRLTVFMLVFVGAWFKLFALFAPARFRPRWGDESAADRRT